jgi:hypothetical protein
MDRRLALAVALLAVMAGCSSAGSRPPAGPAAVEVAVTRDFGGDVLVRARAAPGQSALRALQRVADVDTGYGGRFVRGIAGVRGGLAAGRDWLYFVNGVAADVGAADYELRPGDREWWDFRDWRTLLDIPVVIGSWPEPFVRGYGGRRPRVHVAGLACASAVRAALRRAGARLARARSPFSVEVGLLGRLGRELADWRGRGVTVFPHGGGIGALQPGAGARPVPGARALIAAYRPQGGVGESARVVVAGADRAAACAAARTLAERPADVRFTYAVALDGDGRVLAAGGRG